jgi:hypothetical protein
MTDDSLSDLVAKFSKRAEDLEWQLRQIADQVSEAEKAAYERGLMANLDARTGSLEGKTIVVKVPSGDVEDTCRSLRYVQRKMNCRFIVLADYVDMKELSDVDLRAVGLKRID